MIFGNASAIDRCGLLYYSLRLADDWRFVLIALLFFYHSYSLQLFGGILRISIVISHLKLILTMLKNLILDIGNVICSWNPDGLVGLTFQDPADQQEALRVTVNTSDWLTLDRGEMTVDEAIARAQARTQLADEDIASVYHNLCLSLTALPTTVTAMARARDNGVPMYILSNMQHHAWAYLQKTYECFGWCSGVVVSCEAGLIKPDQAIYQHVCEKFDVTAESCVFVDDMKENIDAAIAFGMQGVQLTDKNKGGEVIDSLVDQIVSLRS